MPEDTQLARQFLAAQELLVGPIHADELVVLRDDLFLLLVVEDEVLDVIEQLLPRKQSRDHRFEARALPLDLLAVDLLLFVLRAQRHKETPTPL